MADGDGAEVERGRGSFIKVLNARLPKKRNIAQALIQDEAGNVLLCELTYKTDWDLPGGVVDPNESPSTCVAREIQEELGVEVTIGELRAVNWLPPYRGWDDASLFLFAAGAVEGAFAEATLLPREIKAIHWVAPADLAAHVAPYTAAMLAHVLAQPSGTAYLENSTPPAN